jgi:hypothetical protein
MNKPLSSRPNKLNSQVEKYMNQCDKNGDEVRQDYLDMFANLAREKLAHEQSEEFKLNNLEYDLRTTDWILAKVRSNESYAQNLYAAMCNNSFMRNQPWPILKDDQWSCSWRYAGGIIADMRQEGDYMDWYCSGIRDTGPPSEEEWNSWSHDQQIAHTNIYSYYVGESHVTDEIKEDLFKLGWLVVEDDNKGEI